MAPCYAGENVELRFEEPLQLLILFFLFFSFLSCIFLSFCRSMFMLLTFILLFNLCFLHIPSFALFHRIFSHIPATCDIFTSPLLPPPSPFPSPSSSSPSPPSLSSYFPFSALSASSPSTPSAAGPRREFHHEGFSLPEHGHRGVTWEGKGGRGIGGGLGSVSGLWSDQRGEKG